MCNRADCGRSKCFTAATSANRAGSPRPGALLRDGPIEPRFKLEHPEDEGDRRAALAHWLTDPRNPLTWRSIVNRVWQYHFGRGLVDTPNDFGRMGALPTHPALLGLAGRAISAIMGNR